MSRHRDDDEHKKENSERWLLTYSDMITLLLVLFIMMYTISKVDLNRFDALASQFSIVMNPSSHAGYYAASPNSGSDSDETISDYNYAASVPAQWPEALSTPRPSADTAEDELLKKIQSLISSDGLSSYVSVHSEERGIIVSLVEGLMFPSGSAKINKEAMPTLMDLASVVASVDNYIRIEGSTDDVPIHSAQYESNWELASQRAINVAELFFNQGVDPTRVSVTSYGEYRPVAPNDTEEHKQLNRRVDIVFLDRSLNVYEPETAAESN